ncbi:MAG: ABC transporter substrate-binding protein [Candidatus Bathyarchaeia archaeon]
MNLKIRFLMVLLILTMVVASMAPSVQTQQENLLRLAFDVRAGTFNPLLSVRDVGLGIWIMPLLYEPLVLRLVNGTVVPWLAKSWEILDDGKRYVFHLDERAKWSDGNPLTARDVELTWNLTMKYAFPTELNGILKEVRAVDEHTVEFITYVPYVRWYFGFGGTMVLPAHIWEKIEDPLSYEFIDDPSKHVTSGPFLYTSYKAGEWWLFKTRQDYWKTESKPKIDGVLMRCVTDFSLYPLLVERGDVDVAIPYPFYLVAQLIGKPNIAIWKFPVPRATEWLAINVNMYPLNMKEVRQAIDLAIDKVDIAENYFMGYGMPANRSLINLAAAPEFTIPEVIWPGLGKTHEENVAEANRMLDALGFTRGPDGVRLTPNGTRLSFKMLMELEPLTAVRLRASERILENLKEIGIEIHTFAPLSIPDFLAATMLAEKKDWGFSHGMHGEWPETWYFQVSTLKWPSVGFTLAMATGWNNTEYNAIANRVLQRLKYDELVSDVKQLLKIYAEELPAIPIAFYPWCIWAYRTDTLTNWQPELSTQTMGSGHLFPHRPMAVNVLTPVKVTPTPTPTATPTATPKPSPTATPTPAATPSPTPTPAGPSIEQIIVIVIVVVIVIAVIGYVVTRTRRKPET